MSFRQVGKEARTDDPRRTWYDAAVNDVNNPTGSTGLVAIDKRGSHALFLDPVSYEILGDLALTARPHEIAISPDHKLAYVSIYGLGVYGNNAQPGNTIVVLDLAARQQVGEIDLSPYVAPHGLMLGPDGLLFASCDASGVVAVIDCEQGEIVGTIDAESTGAHMIAMLPDGSKLYSENEEDTFVGVMDPICHRMMTKIPLPGGAAGISSTADGKQVLVVTLDEPGLAVVDAATDTLTRRVRLADSTIAAQRVRCSPNGRFVVVTNNDESLVTVLSADLDRQTTFVVSKAPMGVAFHPDGQTALVGNHGAGRITVVDLEAAAPVREFEAGVGVETLAFY
jgi:DNA-binding beta-propeller fold protein YncE